MTPKEIITKLNSFGIRVNKPENFYITGSYGKRYSISNSILVDGYTPYYNIPTKVTSQGFIFHSEKFSNFFWHDGNEFQTSKNIDEFIKQITQ